MAAERRRLRDELPSRAAENAFLKEHDFGVPAEFEEEVVDARAFDVEDIDSLDSDEPDVGLLEPLHPRLGELAVGWAEASDALLLRETQAWLGFDKTTQPTDDNLRPVAAALGKSVDDVRERFALWWRMWQTGDAKQAKKKTIIA